MTTNEPTAAELFQAAVGDRIREWREALQISQATLAERSGLSLHRIRRIEAGKANPTVTTLQVLAKALEAEPYELVDVSNCEGKGC